MQRLGEEVQRSNQNRTDRTGKFHVILMWDLIYFIFVWYSNHKLLSLSKFLKGRMNQPYEIPARRNRRSLLQEDKKIQTETTQLCPKCQNIGQRSTMDSGSFSMSHFFRKWPKMLVCDPII